MCGGESPLCYLLRLPSTERIGKIAIWKESIFWTPRV